MFSSFSKKSRSAIIATLLFFIITGLSACDSQPPKPMKAVKQFDTDKELQAHLSHIRKDHMDLLRHKRDETMIRGIRTKENSLKGCIDCHVPVEYNGKVLRHEDPEHFCATCHNYVSADPDCFQCHVDHPVNQNNSASNESASSVLPTVAATNEPVNLAENNTHSGEESSE